MVGRPMTKGIASKASKSSKGVGVGDASTACEKVAKLVVGSNRGEWAVRQTRGMAGTKSVGSGSSLMEGEQEVDPLRISCAANKGEVLGETPARLIVHKNAGTRFVKR